MLNTVWKHNEYGIRIRLAVYSKLQLEDRVLERYTAEVFLPDRPLFRCDMSLEQIQADFTLESPSLHYKEQPDEKS